MAFASAARRTKRNRSTSSPKRIVASRPVVNPLFAPQRAPLPPLAGEGVMRSMTDEGCRAKRDGFEPRAKGPRVLILMSYPQADTPKAVALRATPPHPTFADAKATFPRKGGRGARTFAENKVSTYPRTHAIGTVAETGTGGSVLANGAGPNPAGDVTLTGRVVS